MTYTTAKIWNMWYASDERCDMIKESRAAFPPYLSSWGIGVAKDRAARRWQRYDRLRWKLWHELEERIAQADLLQARVRALEAQVAVLRGPLSALVAVSPLEGISPSCGRDVYFCWYCEGTGESEETFIHDDNCPWAQGKAALVALDGEE